MAVSAETKPTHPTPIEVYLQPVWAHRMKILLWSFIVALVTLGINLLLPNYYRATATLLPETEKSKLSALGQFADIAQLAGVNIPGSEIARLYPTIVTSESVLRSVITRKFKSDKFADSVDLIHYFELGSTSPERNMSTAIDVMRASLSASFDNRNSVVTISLSMREPQLAADVLNALIGELDRFMRSKRVTSASEQVNWLDVRLKQVQTELGNAEISLKDFRERNRRVADSPDLLMQQGRLMREVDIRNAIVVELKKQYELAKLEEIKNITIVNVLDPAIAPVKKDSPHRGTNAAEMFLAVFAGLSAFYGLEPVYGERVREFWGKVRSR